MKDTKLPVTPSNLIRLVNQYATPETLEMISAAWESCPLGERLDLIMESWFSYDQAYIIVKINKSDTWGLISDSTDGDCQEYLELYNAGLIREWHE